MQLLRHIYFAQCEFQSTFNDDNIYNRVVIVIFLYNTSNNLTECGEHKTISMELTT